MSDSSKALLRCAGGQHVNMTEALGALKEVVEPLKRQLCGLLGLFATPELASPAGDARFGEVGWVAGGEGYLSASQWIRIFPFATKTAIGPSKMFQILSFFQCYPSVMRFRAKRHQEPVHHGLLLRHSYFGHLLHKQLLRRVGRRMLWRSYSAVQRGAWRNLAWEHFAWGGIWRHSRLEVLVINGSWSRYTSTSDCGDLGSWLG